MTRREDRKYETVDLRRQLKAFIRTLPSGSELPRREELATALKASRSIVDDLMRDLAHEGWITTGSGRRRTVLPAEMRQTASFVVLSSRAGFVHETELWADLSAGFLVACRSQKVNVAFVWLGADRYKDLVHRPGIDGVLCVGPLPGELDVLAQINAKRAPVVLIEGPANAELDNFGLDPEESIDLALTHLHTLGHTHVGLIGFATENFDLHAEAFRRTAVRLGMEFSLRRMGKFPVVWDERDFLPTDVLGSWIADQGSRFPTAIIAEDAATARSMTSSLMIANLRVPQDVSVVFLRDPGHLFRRSRPTLVEYGGRHVGEQAASRLLDRLHGRNHPPDPHHFRIPVTLVEGSTSGPPPKRRIE